MNEESSAKETKWNRKIGDFVQNHRSKVIRLRIGDDKNKRSKLHGPRKAVGEMMPVLLATRMTMPVSMKGIVKSAACSRSALTVSDVMTMSTFLLASASIKPFHRPFCSRRKKSTEFISNLIGSRQRQIIEWKIVCRYSNEWSAEGASGLPNKFPTGGRQSGSDRK